MNNSNKRSLWAKASAGVASLSMACAGHEPATPDTVEMLVARSKTANAALMQGDVVRYSELVPLAADFTLMSPFGGEPTRGAPNAERMAAMGRFFRDGTLEQEVVSTYHSADMVVLAVIERAHVAVGGLPAQNWALRVTLVYRRSGADWQLVHRHADPLVEGISLQHSASLARGDRPKPE